MVYCRLPVSVIEHKKPLILQLLHVELLGTMECHKVGGDGTMICQNNGMLEHWGVGLTEYSHKTINIGNNIINDSFTTRKCKIYGDEFK